VTVEAGSGPAAAPGAEPLARPAAPAPPIRRGSALALLAAILAGALVLRLWNIDHGLPFAYNADEAEHFVPKAVGMLRGSLDPGYYENPPALTYLLYAIFELRFGGDLVRRFAADPEPAFVTARVAVALIGTLVVALSYWAGARFHERRVGLVAAAIMTVAFLPLFYSKHALNDVVTLAPVTVGLVGCLLVYERGRWVDWALAGLAIGAATATKYTAGAMLLTVALAAALRVHRERAELRRAVTGLALAGAAFAAVFLLLNPWAILDFDEVRGQVGGQSRQADTGKLGQDDVPGWLYYAGTLGWGFGWLPLAAAAGGAVAALRRDPRRALLLVVFPACLYLYMGAQARFFGRWLLPAYPALCVLAGYGVVALASAAARRPRRAGAIVAGLTALACVQGLLSAVHIDTVLGRTDTREQARRWIDGNVPRGAGLVVEPFVPDSWRAALERPVDHVSRPYQAYEKRLRVRRIARYRRQGYCWVVVGSLQKGRGLKAGLRGAGAYYRALDAASASTVTFSPFARGADRVEFSYDASFNYRPRAYDRPGPVVEIHRLSSCTPSVR
jgi:4-amino-4-deoxy-L-arabinose transferase-like glycosyltransferase